MLHPSDRDDTTTDLAATPIWAAPAVEPVWVEPTPALEAKARFTVAERRMGLPMRVVARTAGLVVIGSLMVGGVAIAAFADDGAVPTTEFTVPCSETITVECRHHTTEAAATEEAPATSAQATEEEAPATSSEEPPAPATDAAAPAAPGADASGDPAPPATDSATTTDPGAAPPPETAGGSDGPSAPSDAPTTTEDAPPVSNPLAGTGAADPTASVPTTTFPTYTGDDGSSALSELIQTTTDPVYQLPGAGGAPASSAGSAGVGSGGVAGGPTYVAQAGGISALALFQLQQGASLVPPPAPLPHIEELSAATARQLQTLAKANRVGWPVLAAIRKLGPRRHESLAAAARWLRKHGASADPAKPFASEKALARYLGSKEKGERAAALAAYYFAVGDTGITEGLAKALPGLEQAVLDTPAIEVYAGGRGDLTNHRIDPRVLMAIRYLQAAFGTVRVSTLIEGHSIFTSSGNVSAHIFGRAADISAVGDTAILGNQGPATVTERAIRLLLMLPRDVAPRQIISLMDLDGATGNAGSFALPDHADHIHIGY